MVLQKMSAPTFPLTICHISEGVSLQQQPLWEAYISQSEYYLLQSLQVVMTLHCPKEIEMPLSNQNITVFCQNMMSNSRCLASAFSLMVYLVSCQLLCVVCMWILTHMTPKNVHKLYNIINHPCTWTHLHISVIITILRETLMQRNVILMHPIYINSFKIYKFYIPF